MAITDQTTSLEDYEGSPSYTSIGGGPGGSDNTDIFFEASTSGARFADNATLKGFTTAIASADLSAVGVHVKIWLWLTHYSVVTEIRLRMSDGTNDDDHTFPVVDYPILGGWVPVWIDISRAPENGGSMDEAAITDVGILITIPNIGGTSQNEILDEWTYTTGGLLWDGVSGSFSDFRAHEVANASGIFINFNGVDFLFARLTIGSSTATGFVDSDFQIVCPDQSLIAPTFMGITIDIQNASSNPSLTGGAYSSGDPLGATNRPDLITSGSSGTFDWNLGVLNGLRIITLNVACSFTNGTISNSGQVDAGTGADLSGTSILSSIVAVDEGALLWDNALDPDGELDNMSFSKGTNAHHAIRFGTNVTGDITLRGIDFTGFGSGDDADDSIFRFDATSGSLNLNLVGCTTDDSFSVDDAAGITVIVVIDPVITLVHVDDNDGVALEDARVYLKAANGDGPLPFEESVTITRSGTVATVAHSSHGLATGEKVKISGITDKIEDNNGVHTITVTGPDEYTYVTTDSGSTSYTGTIISTAVLIEGLTDPGGDISVGRTFGSDQPVDGFARASTSSPRFKSFDLAGNTVNSSSGVTINVRLVLDE